MKKIFGTDGIRCIINQEPMTAETCLKIAKVTGYLLSRAKKEKKRVKIIHSPCKDDNISFEDKINSFIIKNSTSIEIIDIKYQRSSILIIYEPK